MRKLRGWIIRFGGLFKKQGKDAELDREIESHLQMHVEDNIRMGMLPDEARREALIQFGTMEATKESYREQRGLPMLETIWQDVRYGARMLRKSPVFTAVAALSLALGIGAGTAIFSLVNGILMSSLPVPNPHELRVLEWSGADFRGGYDGDMRDEGQGRKRGNAFSYTTFLAFREQGATQADVFAYSPIDEVTARARHAAISAVGLMVSDNFFSALAVRPLLGRLPNREDEEVATVVISYRWWEKQFDRDPAVIGQAVTLNGQNFTVGGVLTPGFYGMRAGTEADFYLPLSRKSPDRWHVLLMARLKPHANDVQFQASVSTAFTRLTEKIMKGPKLLVTAGRAGPDTDRHQYREPLILLLSVVGVTLLVACANVAGLSLVRGAARQHEFALRAALGAAKGRLIRQSLTESVLLALLGGVIGTAIALWGKTAVSRLLAGSPDGLHYDTSLDLKVLGFTLATALLTALISGLLPALRAAGADPRSGLKDRGTLGAPRLRTGRILVAAQIALALLLVSGAGLYVRTLVNLVQIKPGFVTENLLLFQLNPRNAGYDEARSTAYFERMQQSLATLPGVGSAALMQFPLLRGSHWGSSFTIAGHTTEGGSESQASMLTVSESFFATLNIPVLLGRELRGSDTATAPVAVVVNETFVRKFLPGGNAVGQVLKRNNTDWQIVGVCRDAKYADIKAEVPPTVYLSFRQNPIESAYFALRTTLPPLGMANAVHKYVVAIDPNVPLTDLSTQEQVRDKTISQELMFAKLCSSLAALSLLLSCIGLYGLMAYQVARRTGEIGIRIALGATRAKIADPILREALLLAGLGVLIGIPLTLALTRLIRSHLYGVGPSDPTTFCIAIAVFLVVGLVAAWLPARRASRVDPMVALRNE